MTVTGDERYEWLIGRGVCMRRAFAGEPIGGNCGPWFRFGSGKPEGYPGCGHPNVLHIGRDCCLTCEMHAVLAELRQVKA